MTEYELVEKEVVESFVEDDGLVISGDSGEWYPYDGDKNIEEVYLVELQKTKEFGELHGDGIVETVVVTLEDWKYLCDEYQDTSDYSFNAKYPQ